MKKRTGIFFILLLTALAVLGLRVFIESRPSDSWQTPDIPVSASTRTNHLSSNPAGKTPWWEELETHIPNARIPTLTKIPLKGTH